MDQLSSKVNISIVLDKISGHINCVLHRIDQLLNEISTHKER